MPRKISLKELCKINFEAYCELTEKITEASQIVEIKSDDKGRLSAITSLGEVFRWGYDTNNQWIEFLAR